MDLIVVVHVSSTTEALEIFTENLRLLACKRYMTKLLLIITATIVTIQVYAGREYTNSNGHHVVIVPTVVVMVSK